MLSFALARRAIPAGVAEAERTGDGMWKLNRRPGSRGRVLWPDCIAGAVALVSSCQLFCPALFPGFWCGSVTRFLMSATCISVMHWMQRDRNRRRMYPWKVCSRHASPALFCAARFDAERGVEDGRGRVARALPIACGLLRCSEPRSWTLAEETGASDGIRSRTEAINTRGKRTESASLDRAWPCDERVGKSGFLWSVRGGLVIPEKN